MSRAQILCPDLGDFKDVPVIEVLVKPGDRVDLETPLLTLETDKATMDVPSTAAGTVVEVLVGKGSKISKGTPLLVIESGAPAAAGDAAAAPREPAAKSSAAPAPAAAAPPAAAPPPAAAAAPSMGYSRH